MAVILCPAPSCVIPFGTIIGESVMQSLCKTILCPVVTYEQVVAALTTPEADSAAKVKNIKFRILRFLQGLKLAKPALYTRGIISEKDDAGSNPLGGVGNGFCRFGHPAALEQSDPRWQ